MSFGGTTKKIASGRPGYELFKQAKIGDLVRYSGNKHYAVFISCDKNGITLYHANVNGSKSKTGNYNEDEVTFVGVSSSINVVDFIYGDVNGDGKINGRDLVKLRKYLANYNESTGESTIVLGPSK